MTCWKDGLNPDLVQRVERTLEFAANAGLPPADVFAGLRTIEQQDALYALGRTVRNTDGSTGAKPLGNIVTKAKGGQSWHNYGLAVDIVFRPRGEWSWAPSLPWTQLGDIGTSHGLEWGGAWEFLDLPHFQRIGGLTLAEALDLHGHGGMRAVWLAVGKKYNMGGAT